MTTREEIIRMAREAGLEIGESPSGVYEDGERFGAVYWLNGSIDLEPLDRFAALVAADLAAEVTRLEMECAALHSRMKVIAAATREECAKVCEEACKERPSFKEYEDTYMDGWQDANNEACWAIRELK